MDCDKVILDPDPQKAALAKELFGIDILPEQCKREVAVPGILTLEQYREIQKTLFYNWEMSKGILPVPGAVDYVRMLMDSGHFIKVITSRTGEALEIAQRLCRQHGLEIFDWQGVGHDVSKKEAAKGLDVYVDDDYDKLEDLIGIVPNLILFAWPANQGITLDPRIIRIEGWENLFQHIA
ncbi:MAG: hypothetical protein Q8P32_01225 [Candidatus Komeilibacteria bacterium]|nr:hypothetical protein [Candidatus Komeilibacteria bacterium]